MNFSLRILLISCSYLLLTACIDKDNSKLEILGSWESKDSEKESYMYFSSNEVTNYTKHTINECFTIDRQEIISLTNFSFSIDSTQSPGTELELRWSVAADILTITNTSHQKDFTYSRTVKDLSRLEICSDNGESNPDTPDTPEIIGSWQNENGFQLILTESKFVSIYLLSNLNCHSQKEFDISELTDSSLKINHEIVNYTIADKQLTFDNSATYYTPSALTIEDLISCTDPESDGSINIEVKFNELPDFLEINHAQSSDIWTAFELNIQLDLDGNKRLSNGDLNFFAGYHLEREKSDIEIISITELKPSIYYTHTVNSNEQNEYLRSTVIIEPQINIEANTITFSIDRKQHKALREMGITTPIKIDTRFNDSQGGFQYDRYPNHYNYTLEHENIADLVDGLNDVNGNYNSDTIVDISTISITVTK